ncbi:MAG: RNA-binding protein [Gammaproteobacteria bacterium]|jgi:RNA recognition motif-containing protein
MNNKIYMGNLPFSYKEQELEEVFAKYGNIKDIFLVRDRNTKRLKGFGFIEFDTAEAATAALEMDGQELGGRQIKVAMAKEKEKEN